MSGSAWIRVKQTRTGPRYVVLYRLGGRTFPQRNAGSFKRQDVARERRNMVAGEIAAGRDPRVRLHELAHPPAPAELLEACAQRWLRTRLDLAAKTVSAYRFAIARICGGELELGRLAPAMLDVETVQEWVVENGDLAASTLAAYMATFRQILDFAGVDPNPARDRAVRLPRETDVEVEPPTAEQLEAMFRYIRPMLLLPLAVIEQSAMRVSEPELLEWRDVDVQGCRFRIRAETVKGRRGRRRGRWVGVPPWLMQLVADSCPPDDRAGERRVFIGFTHDRARKAMERACRAAGLPHFHPHDLRHRRISIWHHKGVPQREISDRAGHAKPSLTLDVYTHVMPLEEIPVDRYRALLPAPEAPVAVSA